MRPPFPILEFDSDTSALIEPSRLHAPIDMPACAVICFLQDVIGTLVREYGATVIHELKSEMGAHPIYEIAHDGRRLAVFFPGIGAPFAAALFEEAIALGCKRFVACGGCGVLDSGIAVGHVLVPKAAVRDEGTSYHYAAPSREIGVTPAALAAVEATLRDAGIDYLVTKTWTTDGFYRETQAKIAQRRAEGCLCVEMETAALCAVARFRGVEFAQLLYGGDDLGGEAWDSRKWTGRGGVRERLFWLAATACLAIQA